MQAKSAHDARAASGLPASFGFLLKWGSHGSGDGQFYRPEGITTDAAGNLYVVDNNNERIEKFSPLGVFLGTWGSPGRGDGQFNEPGGIATDAVGNFYVVDSGNNRVEKFSPSGVFLGKWGSLGTGDGQFNWGLGGIAIDAAGNVYVADTGNNRIEKFSSTGAFLGKWDVSNPYSIATDASGNVYVGSYWSTGVNKFSSSGDFLGSYESMLAHALATDAAGNLYVAEAESNQLGAAYDIRKYSASGILLGSWGGTGANDGQFADPHGITVDAAGNVYVADTENDRIQKFGELPTRPNLAPDPNFEAASGSPWYTNGTCQFSRASDAVLSPTHALKIVATTSGLCRWLSQAQRIAVTPGTTYDASVFGRTNLGQNGVAYLALNFWTASGAYIPSTVDSPTQLTGSTDWTQLQMEATAPPGAAFVRMELRLSGLGTVWFDDASLTTHSIDASPPETTIVGGYPDGTIVPPGPVSFSFAADKPGSGFQCSLDGASFATCSSPAVYSGLAAGPHTFAVRAVSQAGVVDPTPATRTWTVGAESGANLAPDPDFQQPPYDSYSWAGGDGRFSWSTASGHASAGFLRIDSNTATLARWFSSTNAMRATPGATYLASVYARTQDLRGTALLSVNFWTEAGLYIPATVDSRVQLSGTQDWTQLVVQTTAPAGAAFIRVEFRQSGPGTSWFDDVDVRKQ